MQGRITFEKSRSIALGLTATSFFTPKIKFNTLSTLTTHHTLRRQRLEAASKELYIRYVGKEAQQWRSTSTHAADAVRIWLEESEGEVGGN